MTDYAATPLQPIAQGLLTVSGAAAVPPHVPNFSGTGVTKVERVLIGPDIYYVFTLDKGLPGNSGEIDPDKARLHVNIRGSATNPAVPFGTSITAFPVTYITPGSGGGMTQFRLCFLAGGISTDPTDDAASGVEIDLWKSPLVP